jgi:SAM-dependent methyltransferase
MTGVAVYKKRNCRLCGNPELETVVKLTPTPPGNHFVTVDKVAEPQEEYPLELDFCTKCYHVQLGHVVNPQILYQQNYSYVSGTSPVFVAHLRECCEHIMRRYSPARPGLVVDIGSNDGTALRFYKEAGYQILGFDPATEIAQRATESGIETVCEFFGRDVGERYAAIRGKASLINSHNACAHIDDLRGVLEGVKHLLAPNGLFVMEVGYLVDIVENMWFDTIYHEHVDFHSVAPLVPFFASVGLEVIAVERISPQGGSIRVISQHHGADRRPDSSIEALTKLEETRGLQEPEAIWCKA